MSTTQEYKLVWKKTATRATDIPDWRWTATLDGFRYVIDGGNDVRGDAWYTMAAYGDEAGLISQHGVFTTLADVKAHAVRVHAHLKGVTE